MPSDGVTLKHLAQICGVSLMTVSRAIRGAPRVASKTREAVLKAVQALGYEPDPHLHRMMKLVRSRKRVRMRAVMAVLREDIPRDDLVSPSYQFVPIEEMRRRARGYGYEVEEFWLGRGTQTPYRVQRILEARGIEGVLVSPQSEELLCAQMDYSPFAAVTFGYAMSEPALHMCAGNMNLGIQRAALELDRRGYRRIGLAITPWIDRRSQNGYSAGMLHFQKQIPRSRRVPILMMPYNNLGRCFGVFANWMRKCRPDALITFETHAPSWLKRMGLRIPEDVGFVVHDWTTRMSGFAGIYQRRDHLAAAAVDLVITQLSQNERGVPAVPRQLMIPPEWVEGPSVRPK